MTPGDDAFLAAKARFDALADRLGSAEAGRMTHAELEDLLSTDGRQLLQQLLQDHLDLRAVREKTIEAVVDAEGVPRTHTVADQAHTLTTVFGDVRFRRLAYRRRGYGNLHPADAVLNLPPEQYSHGLRRLAAIEASKVSFDEAVKAVREATRAPTVEVPKRQLEALVAQAAVDFDDFYAQPERAAQPSEMPLALSFDGKGVVMRTKDLRSATAAAATADATTGRKRRGTSSKANRKRMAELAAVFDVNPAPRTADDIMAPPGADKPQGPTISGQWVTVSVTESLAAVVAQGFDEAERRDPRHRRKWIVLVDGNNDQLRAIRGQARKRRVAVTIAIDFIHVCEYLWKAAHCFFAPDDPEADDWVRDKAREILDGRAPLVAAAIRRKATVRLGSADRQGADECADYLLRKKAYLDYPTALAAGWPIATGVIEGACRHLVQDRMDITGARWQLTSAEAVLKLRSLRTNGDFDRYWTFHLAREQERVHSQHYAGQAIPGQG